MGFSLVISEDAQREIEAYAVYISGDDPRAATRWASDVQTALESLREMPARCPVVREARLARTGFRHLLVHSHRILFRVDDEVRAVRIIRFVHQRQDLR